MRCLTALDHAKTTDVFSELISCRKDVGVNKGLANLSGQYTPRFDPETLDRYFVQQSHGGIGSKVYEDGSFDLLFHVPRNIRYLEPLGIVVSPIRYCIDLMTEIKGHREGKPYVKVPKNNLDKDFMMIMDMSDPEAEYKGFGLIRKRNPDSIKFIPNEDGTYSPQNLVTDNVYMPPNKEVRKAHKTKIDDLIKKVTLMSYIKSDGKLVLTDPDEFGDLYRMSDRGDNAAIKYAAILEFVESSYDAQMCMKQVIESPDNYRLSYLTRHCVKNMLKYYSDFRNEVGVDHFTCKFNYRT